MPIDSVDPTPRPFPPRREPEDAHDASYLAASARMESFRWVSIAFTITVIANFVALARGNGTPPAWITYSPLLPLALLLFTGLYLFVLPYVARWRSRRRMPETSRMGR